MRAFQFLAGLLAGLSVGGTLALLTTPSRGRQMRESLAREAKRATVRATGLHPVEWREITSEEARKRTVRNIERIRSAGF